jgi:hypothetical protein
MPAVQSSESMKDEEKETKDEGGRMKDEEK